MVMKGLDIFLTRNYCRLQSPLLVIQLSPCIQHWELDTAHMSIEQC